MTPSEIRSAIAEVTFPQPHSQAFLVYLKERAEKAWSEGDEDVPALGYLMFESLVVYDLTTGVDGFTGERIVSQAAGMPEMAYHLLTKVVRRQFPPAYQDELVTAMNDCREASVQMKTDQAWTDQIAKDVESLLTDPSED